MKMNKTLLLVDFMGICYSSFYKLPSLHSSSGMASAVTYGVLSSLQTLHQRFQPDEMILCMDSRDNKRKEIFPGYKAKRVKNDSFTDMIAQVVKLKKRLPEIGLPCAECDGYESDDLIAVLLETIGYSKAIVCTSDNDLYQLVSDKVSVWDTRLKKIIDLKSISNMFGFSDPMMIAIYKALAGCSSDNVPGLRGVGEIGAKAFMKEHQYNLDSMVGELREKNLLNKFDFMLRLVALPLDLDYKIPIRIEGESGIDRKALAKLFYDYDINRLDVKGFML